MATMLCLSQLKMSDTETEFSIPAFSACMRLLYETNAFDNTHMPYCKPYINYVMSWCHYLPIKTIIIGQNPYPNNIYPEFGSAFSYDESKQSSPPKTVQNLAHDVNNYDGTNIDDAISCFRDSWKCLESGTIFINETALDFFYKDKSNTRGIKEMESQIRALQIIITESYTRGQTTFTCIGMGIKAAQMTSILRSWYPKDLMKMRVITCKNPAARDIGDMQSHEITIGNKGASKVLSSIVTEFIKMSGKRMTPAEQRAKQNKTALVKATENLVATSDIYGTELMSFEERIKGFTGDSNAQCTPEELAKSLGQLRTVITRHKNAVQVHSNAFIMAHDSMLQSSDRSDKTSSGTAQQLPVPIEPRPSAGPRRKIIRKAAETPSTMRSVEETPEPSMPSSTAPIIVPESTPTPSVAPPRARRILRRNPTQASSVAGTEYSVSTLR